MSEEVIGTSSVEEYEYLVTIKSMFFTRKRVFCSTTINGAILKAMKKHRFSSIEAAERIY